MITLSIVLSIFLREDIAALLPKLIRCQCSERPRDDPSQLRLAEFSANSTNNRLMEEARLSPNGGWLRIERSDGETQWVGVSMYHQLHCIGLLETYLGISVDTEMHHTHEHASEEIPDHLVHCMKYITQVRSRDIDRKLD
jgi:hypothetical protein